MEVEWREEHEDALLHEVLLCLKALSTTALALQHLDRIQVTLFPALLHDQTPTRDPTEQEHVPCCNSCCPLVHKV
ncbi:hypothetical protein QBC46DRAFT_401948 [Diplogelasinospora grovesii]|uniref:Uncharacterized protein n=1 Tax=Diplogelasinospora grovesii TaxID=303347 RepID=A0AAN6MX26_9PEZI|nr:hypothetical protein QBC46DRAFT_401948 [Diplogelasinospora grovesii]